MHQATTATQFGALLLALLVGAGCGSSTVGDSASGAVQGGPGTGHDRGAAAAARRGRGTMGSDGTAEQQCVDIINNYRATLDLPPYARWTDQEACASSEAASDSQSGTAHGAFGMCKESAQNECPGYSGSYVAMLPSAST